MKTDLEQLHKSLQSLEKDVVLDEKQTSREFALLQRGGLITRMIAEKLDIMYIDGTFVSELWYDGIKMKLDNYALTFFNKVFSANLKAVYSYCCRFPSKTKLNTGCTTFIIVNADNRIIEMYNSEWGGVEE